MSIVLAPPLLDELLLDELLLGELLLLQPTAAKATAVKAVIMVICLIVFLSFDLVCPAVRDHTDLLVWAPYTCRSRDERLDDALCHGRSGLDVDSPLPSLSTRVLASGAEHKLTARRPDRSSQSDRPARQTRCAPGQLRNLCHRRQ